MLSETKGMQLIRGFQQGWSKKKIRVVHVSEQLNPSSPFFCESHNGGGLQLHTFLTAHPCLLQINKKNKSEKLETIHTKLKKNL